MANTVLLELTRLLYEPWLCLFSRDEKLACDQNKNHHLENMRVTCVEMTKELVETNKLMASPQKMAQIIKSIVLLVVYFRGMSIEEKITFTKIMSNILIWQCKKECALSLHVYHTMIKTVSNLEGNETFLDLMQYLYVNLMRSRNVVRHFALSKYLRMTQENTMRQSTNVYLLYKCLIYLKNKVESGFYSDYVTIEVDPEWVLCEELQAFLLNSVSKEKDEFDDQINEIIPKEFLEAKWLPKLSERAVEMEANRPGGFQESKSDCEHQIKTLQEAETILGNLQALEDLLCRILIVIFFNFQIKVVESIAWLQKIVTDWISKCLSERPGLVEVHEMAKQYLEEVDGRLTAVEMVSYFNEKMDMCRRSLKPKMVQRKLFNRPVTCEAKELKDVYDREREFLFKLLGTKALVLCLEALFKLKTTKEVKRKRSDS